MNPADLLIPSLRSAYRSGRLNETLGRLHRVPLGGGTLELADASEAASQ
jgi:hypothetical protein